ncbi:dipeptide/oligopeptide/nickel ABC transporter permease/ATP-binding protein [Streptosporangium sp. NBC_01755]|uniref:dipeptide/oligopeptide/nickel ABC transporter permease/ATP-binding protein n=1 Tax=Streptosporangium sp. NBC_01755 TaxID=2975949 RepID=UPI002DD91699|nr:dipeptide/oligopeptide/nickel ABC transporter permease/ATP-binding protein [Streptosporangium sp. NBC_01755]WSD00342.1 dipeptide/oligopeptide/nickel ABC transporter permease/ATP-binding protein [Streptosporangium sp. NBC_01755]
MSAESSPMPAAGAEPGQWRTVIARFRRHRLAVVSLVVLVLVALFAFVGPLLWHYRYDQITPDNSQPPSATHPLGTDSLGHDLLAQVMRGTQQSLLIALSVALGAALIGTVTGIVAGFYRGRTDAVLMRVVDLFLTVPTIAVAAVLGHNFAGESGWFLIAAVLAALMWTTVARVVRGVVLGLREREFVAAARSLGASNVRIMASHILPNVAGPIIVSVTILVAGAILAETALSFIGFGVQPPDTSLGLLIANAQSAVGTRPWLFYSPGVVILLIALSINFIGDGLRDALDPAHTRGPRRRRYLAQPAQRTDVIPDEVLLSIRDLRVVFAADGGDVPAVRRLDLDLRRGEVVGLVGESGSGKSVSAAAIMGLLPPTATVSGSIRFAGQEVIGLAEPQYRRLRGRRVAMVFQDPMSSLSPVHTIGDQVAEAVRVHQGCSWAAARDRAVELLDVVGVPDARNRLRDYPHQFSGGMRQRVVIAMAIANDPDLIIADEPTTALDVTVQAQVLAALRAVRERTGAAILLITHDLGIVAQVADRIAVMYAGRLVETGTAVDVFDHPAMPYTRGLLDSIPRLDRPADDELWAIPGSPPTMTALPAGCAFAPRCAIRTAECAESEPDLRQVSAGHLAACLHLTVERM